jgi:hypothetical protein
MESGNWVIDHVTISDSTDNAYADLVAATEALTKAPPGWRLSEFKHLVLVDCEYVYALWKLYGNGQMDFGSLPVLTNKQMTTVMNRVK